MVYLKNQGAVRIVKESSLVVTVQAMHSEGFDSKGEPIFQSWTLSKKHHKNSLFIKGTDTCIL